MGKQKGCYGRRIRNEGENEWINNREVYNELTLGKESFGIKDDLEKAWIKIEQAAS